MPDCFRRAEWILAYIEELQGWVKARQSEICVPTFDHNSRLDRSSSPQIIGSYRDVLIFTDAYVPPGVLVRGYGTVICDLSRSIIVAISRFYNSCGTPLCWLRPMLFWRVWGWPVK